MNNFDIRSVDKSTLHDISSVKIDTSLPCEERVKNYVQQIGNPYCYLDNGIIVGIGYTDTEITLQDRLKAYARQIH